ncbi:hypothetical protein ACQW02_26675 [Humitalea sp. 24SJ18S-53]|uniref:hypothetical protein n=1 Tax=Humitalea sp. 24SJ18S-53 TaxID=3422307 RepID=UPI003D663FE1
MENTVLSHSLVTIFDKTGLKRGLDGFGPVVDDTPWNDHLAIMAAPEARRFPKAEEILRQHIRAARVRPLLHHEANRVAMMTAPGFAL